MGHWRSSSHEFLWKTKSKRKRGETSRQRREANERLQCAHPGCYRNRYTFARYCQKHHSIWRRYGHPDGCYIPRSDYQAEIDEIREFMVRHRDHPTLVAAIKVLDLWLDRSCVDKSLPAWKDMRRLYDYGVKGEQVVATFLPLWLYSHRRPERLPDDLRLTIAMGHAVLLLAPLEKYTAQSRSDGTPYERCKLTVHSAKRYVGETIRTYLGVFAKLAIDEIQKRIEQENQLLLQTRRGFASVAVLENGDKQQT